MTGGSSSTSFTPAFAISAICSLILRLADEAEGGADHVGGDEAAFLLRQEGAVTFVESLVAAFERHAIDIGLVVFPFRADIVLDKAVVPR